MRRVVISPGAAYDIQRLRAFIHPKNPDAARRAVQTIRAGVKLLGADPEIGRPLLNLGPMFRERMIGFGESMYVVRYAVTPTEILVIAIRHGRETDRLA